MNVSRKVPLVVVSFSEGSREEKQRYCLLKVGSCCVSEALVGDGKVRPGAALQEKQLRFG